MTELERLEADLQSLQTIGLQSVCIHTWDDYYNTCIHCGLTLEI